MSEGGEGILVVPGVRMRRNDDQNVVIEKWKERENKPGHWVIVGFYPSVQIACEALTNRHMHLIVDEEGCVLMNQDDVVSVAYVAGCLFGCLVRLLFWGLVAACIIAATLRLLGVI